MPASMQMADAITIVDKSRNSDGFLKVRARSARAGVYDYLGAEVDPTGQRFKAADTVKVYRPADEVFDKASLASFIGRAITNDHPTVPVNASNWRDHARGAVFGAVKDGDYVGFDLAFMDAATITAIESGKRELSNGYACDLAFEDGTAPDGTAYQAVQRNIRGNHVALVDRGRAGPECRVADAQRWAACDANPAALDGITSEKPKMKITIGDAKDVDLSDGAAVALAVGALNTSLTDAQTKVGTLTADLATAQTAIQTKDGEIAALNVKLADAEITPEKLQALADARADVIGKAKALAPNIATDGKTDAEIRKEAVTAKLGDAALSMADAAIEGAFIAFSKDAKSTVHNITPMQMGDSAADAEDAAHQRMVDRLTGQKRA